jgi:hypothetical protein
MSAPAHDDAQPPPPPSGDGDAAGAAARARRRLRRWLPRRRTARAAPEPPPDAPAAAPPADAATDGAAEPAAGPLLPEPLHSERPGRLRRRRRRLLTRREEAVYHLGGLAFELYRRGLLAEEVMRRRAGDVALLDDTVRDIDVRLDRIERERRERRRRGPRAEEPAGHCLDCRAPFHAEARFCWQCGARLLPDSEGDEHVTAVILARPAPAGDARHDPAPGP